MELLNLLPFIFTLLLISLLFKLTTRTTNPRLPPGPRNLPIIGSLHHLRGSHPHHALQTLAKTYGPIMHLKLGEVPTVVVSSGEAAKEMLKTHDRNFLSRSVGLAVKIMLYDGADMIFSPYGNQWRQLRRLFVTELMNAKRVHSFRSIREEESLELMRSISGSDSDVVNLSKLLHSFTNNLTNRVSIGNKCEDGEKFLEGLKESLELASGFKAADLFPSWAFAIGWVTGMRSKLDSCHRKTDAVLQRILEEHSRDQTKNGSTHDVEESFLDVLLNLQAHGGLGFQLTNDNIKAIIFDIFGAGSGTSAAAMTWTMSELIKNPRVMKKLQAEIRQSAATKDETNITESEIKNLTYLKLVIKETLRLHPPAPLLVPRECIETCEIQGYVIPAKTRVVFNGYAMGRDPKCWDDPEAFVPERFEWRSIDFSGTGSDNNYEYIPFGAGRRMCPGVQFGLSMMEVALGHLLYYFEWSLPDGMRELDMSEASGLGARRKHDLLLSATPCVSLKLQHRL